MLLRARASVVSSVAWCAHLRHLADHPRYMAALVSRGIALLESPLPVPALPQLKLMREVITLAASVPFATPCMRQALRSDQRWAAGCLLGAVHFTSRGQRPA